MPGECLRRWAARCARRSISSCRRWAREAIPKVLPARAGADRCACQPRRAHRCGAGHDRGPQLPQEPVQPRNAGRAPARLCVQAVRARGRARKRYLALDHPHVEAGDDRSAAGSGTSATTRATTSARSTCGRQSRIPTTRCSPNSRISSARQPSPRWRKSLGIGTPLQPYFSIGLGGEPATPLDMARSYAAFANGGYRIDGAIFGNEPRVVECLEDADGNCKRTGQLDRCSTGCWSRGRRPPTTRCSRESSRTGPAGRPSSRAPGGRQDGHDRELRRRLVRRVHARRRHRGLGRLPGRAAADAHRVPRAAGCRRHLPGDDLEGLHGERGAVSRPRGELVAQPSFPYSSSQRVVIRDRRLLLDNGYCSGTTTLQLFSTTQLPVAACAPS